jgi:hypothetical protein
MTITQLLFGTSLAIAISLQPGTAQAQSAEKPSWVALQASIPEHAIILAWHKALVANDYAAYLRHTGEVPGLSDAQRREHFAKLRTVTPGELKVTAGPTRVNPNGTKEYFVAGCVKMPGDPKDMRVVALLLPHQRDGQWRILGSDFSVPWNDTVRSCPVK